jgi:hypothetical protein
MGDSRIENRMTTDLTTIHIHSGLRYQTFQNFAMTKARVHMNT